MKAPRRGSCQASRSTPHRWAALRPARSGLLGGLREERAHERLQLLAAAARATVLSAFPLPDAQDQRDFFLARLAVELVVGHGRSPSLSLRPL